MGVVQLGEGGVELQGVELQIHYKKKKKGKAWALRVFACGTSADNEEGHFSLGR